MDVHGRCRHVPRRVDLRDRFGAYELLRGEGETEGFEIAYAVLAIAAVAEGTSWLRAPRQTKAEAKETGKPTFSWSRSRSRWGGTSSTC